MCVCMWSQAFKDKRRLLADCEAVLSVLLPQDTLDSADAEQTADNTMQVSDTCTSMGPQHN